MKATERAEGVRLAGKDRIGSTLIVPPNDAPTLAALGLTKKESAQAQMLASLLGSGSSCCGGMGRSVAAGQRKR